MTNINLPELELQLSTAVSRQRDANIKVEELSLVLLAGYILEKYPTATQVDVESSDQGPYMTVRGPIYADDEVFSLDIFDEEHDGDIEFEDWVDGLNSLACNLDCVEGVNYRWEEFLDGGRLTRSGFGSLQLGPIVEHNGDAYAYLLAKQAQS